MKHVRIIALSLAIAFSANFLVSCYGSFSLVKKVYKWNGSLGNKWVKTLVMWVLIIIPVYEFAGLIDWWILNTIEFWTGSNPMAMNEGDEEIQKVKKDGNWFEIKATKNRFDVTQLTGKDAGKKSALIFNDEDNTWSAESNGKTTKLLTLLQKDGNAQVQLHLPNNETAVLDFNAASSIVNPKSIYNYSNSNIAAK